MPANSMFDPPLTTLLLRLEDLSTDGDPGFNLWVATKRLREVEKTKWVAHFTGLEVDHLETVVATAVRSYLYHEPRDLQRRLAAAHKAARVSAAAHQF